MTSVGVGVGSTGSSVGVAVGTSVSVGVGVTVIPSSWVAVASPGNAINATTRMRAGITKRARYFFDMVNPPLNQLFISGAFI